MRQFFQGMMYCFRGCSYITTNSKTLNYSPKNNYQKIVQIIDNFVRVTIVLLGNPCSNKADVVSIHYKFPSLKIIGISFNQTFWP